MMDHDLISKLFAIEEKAREHNPAFNEIHKAVVQQLKDINQQIGKDNQKVVEAAKKAQAEEAHKQAVVQAEKPKAQVYPAGIGVQETDTSKLNTKPADTTTLADNRRV